MKDWLHGALKVVDYERGKVFGVLLAIVIVVVMVGCDVQVASPFSGEKVTRDQFRIEKIGAEGTLETQRYEIERLQADYNRRVALHNEQVGAAEAKFVEAEKFRDGFFEIASGALLSLATGGSVDTAQVLMSLLMLGGIGGTVGGMYDSNRKNKLIEAKEQPTATA